MEECNNEYHVEHGLNDVEKEIHEDIRLVSTIEGSYYEITLTHGKRREVRLICYRHSQFKE